tara:strand:+ start:52 stop:258 length:207 start_codon:yes stop_codon:yes gene_type:complete
MESNLYISKVGALSTLIIPITPAGHAFDRTFSAIMPPTSIHPIHEMMFNSLNGWATAASLVGNISTKI